MSGVSLDGRSGFFNSNMPFAMAVGLGVVPGATRVVLLGHNPDFDFSTQPEDIWEGGGVYPFLAAAATLAVSSASAADTAAGTGARTVLVSGLNSSYNTITETVTLNGTTPVNTVNQFLRVNLFTTVTSGSGGVNAGDLTLRVTGGGTIQSIARAGYGFGRSAIYTVPAGFTFFMTSAVFSILQSGIDNLATFGIAQRSSTGNLRIPIEFQVSSNAPYMHNTPEGIVFPEKTDVMLRLMQTQQDDSQAVAAAAGILFNNSQLPGM